jgi:hypothetical protein
VNENKYLPFRSVNQVSRSKILTACCDCRMNEMILFHGFERIMDSGARQYIIITIIIKGVGIATSYRFGGRGLIPGRGEGFSLIHRVQTGSWAYSPSYRMGTGRSFPGVNRPGRDVELYLRFPIRLHGVVRN